MSHETDAPIAVDELVDYAKILQSHYDIGSGNEAKLKVIEEIENLLRPLKADLS
jgi:hypothetical protein